MKSNVKPLTCFKAYDVRGKIGHEFNNKIACRIGRAFAKVLDTKKVVVGFDARETSLSLAHSLSEGLKKQGTDILNIGLSGTEEVYWATSQFKACGGIIVTASHNPADYNGLKFVKTGSTPLSPDKELQEIKVLAETENFIPSEKIGKIINIYSQAKELYVKKILSFYRKGKKRKLKILVDFGNGAAGPTFDLIEKELSNISPEITFVKENHKPDSKFPNGVPNPLLKENQAFTSKRVKATNADLGIAFDGDFDRCFFFDELGNFVSGEYIVGLLAGFYLGQVPKLPIVYDNRVIWNIENIIERSKGKGVKSKTGHAFIKAEMRKRNAIYGGELSAHHYFRDFAFCDSGMIPWLMILFILCETQNSFSSLISSMSKKFPSSGEINIKAKNADMAISEITNFFKKGAKSIDFVDGVSMILKGWRFNLRKSNTESLLRLNVESMGNKSLLDAKVAEIIQLLSKSQHV